jgi:glycogen operon protein
MLLGGDERGRTQGGNNNAWCQDNEISWYDWELDDDRASLLDFTRRLLGLRRDHPVFRRTDFLDGGPAAATLPDAWWFRPDGRQMAQRDWQNPDFRELGVFLNGDETGIVDSHGEHVVDDSFVVLLNATPEDIVFRLPPRRFGIEWELALSTADPDAGAERYPGRASVDVPARSLVLLRRVR